MAIWKKILLGLGAVIVAGVTFVVVKIGPKNVIGMIRYDQRKEGELRVGDRAPDALLVSLDGASRQNLLHPSERNRSCSCLEVSPDRHSGGRSIA